MPLYTGIDGTMKELSWIYANIDGTAKSIKNLYGGVGGTAKEIFTSGYRWIKYNILPTVGLTYIKKGTATYEEVEYARVNYAKTANDLQWKDVTALTVLFKGSNQGGYTSSPANMDSEEYGYYVGLDSYTSVTIYSSGGTSRSTSSPYVMKLTGSSSSNRTFTGEIYRPTAMKGDTVIDIVYSENLNDYPLNGIKDGYWYVYDGT